MRHVVYSVVLSALVASGLSMGQSDKRATSPAVEQARQISKLLSKPLRHDGPLRYENITDQEVREVQKAVAAVVPGALVNIGSVIEGCACEEGRACTDQLWVVAHQPSRDVGLSLSRIEGHWGIGRLQDWLIRYEAFQMKYRGGALAAGKDARTVRAAYFDEQQAFLLEMPQCNARAVAPADQAASASIR